MLELEYYYCGICKKAIYEGELRDHSCQKPEDLKSVDSVLDGITRDSINIHKIKTMKFKMEQLKPTYPSLREKNKRHLENQIRILQEKIRDLINEIHVKGEGLKQEFQSYYEENDRLLEESEGQNNRDLESLELIINNLGRVNNSNLDPKVKFIKLFFEARERIEVDEKRQVPDLPDLVYSQVNSDFFEELSYGIQFADNCSFYNQSLVLEKEQTVFVHDKLMNKRDLLVKSIDLDPRHFDSLIQLARTMSRTEEIQFKFGPMSRKDIVMKCFELIKEDNLNLPMNDILYYLLGEGLALDGEVTLPIGDCEKTFNRIELLLRATDNCIFYDDEMNSNIATNLGGTILVEKTKPNGGRLGDLKCTTPFLKMINMRPNNSMAYNYLSLMMFDGETVMLENGRVFNNKDCYKEALRLDPTNHRALNNLSKQLEFSESFELFPGIRYTKKEMLIEAIKLNPKYHYPYHNLADLLTETETVTIGETVMTKKDLYRQAIGLSLSSTRAYINLSNLLEPNETITLLDHRQMDKKDLLLESLKYPPWYDKEEVFSNSYYELSKLDEDQINHDGRELTKIQLLVESLKLNPKNTNSLSSIQNFMNDNQIIEINGEHFNKIQFLNYIDSFILNDKNDVKNNNNIQVDDIPRNNNEEDQIFGCKEMDRTDNCSIECGSHADESHVDGSEQFDTRSS